MLIGIVGKPSSGKSTFLNSACLTDAKTGNYPFTTIEPNLGTGYVKVDCVCSELKVNDNPKNSKCINNVRYIPIKLLDVAGLVPDAHLGKGRGNQFLADLTKADVLLHIVDISGELDSEGNDLGDNINQDPLEDIKFLEREIDMWFKDILLRKDWNKFTNKVAMEKINFGDALYERLSGLSIKKHQIFVAIKNTAIEKAPNQWSNEEIEKFASELRKSAKPIIIVANKIDKKRSEDNFKELKKIYKEKIIPSSSLAELTLRKMAENGIINYLPGDSNFNFIDKEKINQSEYKVLINIKEKILDKYGDTGVQTALNYAIFNILDSITVYPVNDEKKYTDKDGNILPDIYLVPNNMNIKTFVNEKVHSDLAKNFIYAIDARTKKRLGENYQLKNRDIIKIYSAAKKKH
jgi:ribosome-binding ATPase YchF (GTP1/OBG family)